MSRFHAIRANHVWFWLLCANAIGNGGDVFLRNSTQVEMFEGRPPVVIGRTHSCLVRFVCSRFLNYSRQIHIKYEYYNTYRKEQNKTEGK